MFHRKNSVSLSIAKLKEFPLFAQLPDDELLLIAARAQLMQKVSGQELFHLDERDAHDFFLLKGSVRLLMTDGREYAIQSATPRGFVPLARMRPRQHTAIAQGTVDYFVLPTTVVEELAEKIGDDEQVGFTVADFDADDREDMLAAFQRDLSAGRIILRSLPEVAVHVRKLMEDDNVTSQKIADAINCDPIIAAKIIKAANSPAYWGAVQCETVQGAIFRLGMATTQKLIMCFTLRDLFETTSPELKKRMTELWERCVDVAAISFVLAKVTRSFSPEEAMLAGLLSRIGEFAVLHYAVNYPGLFNDQAQMQLWCDTLCGPLGKQLLEKWHFPQDLADVAGNSQQWMRNDNTHADLSDVVLVATLQSLQSKNAALELPIINQLPAFVKLKLGELTADKTLVVVEQAKTQLDAARQLLVA
jgi:HD-like signal output (HDOD) protein